MSKYIIDIPEVTYQEVKWRGLYLCPRDSEALVNSIKTATPYLELPHGEWIPCNSTRTGQITYIDYKCSKCSHHRERPMPYCEICGAIMKRSDKE